jgi:hypothetical protein
MKTSYRQKRLDALKYLPYRYAKELQRRLDGKYSISYIRQVISNQHENDEIMQCAMEYGEERRARLEKLIGKKI